MKTIAIMNYKGGVGKTVTTINFAAELAAAGKSVIVMDADGQCNLSDIFRADTLHGGTTYEVLTGETGCCWDELVQDTPVEGVKIVPASAELPKADIAALTGERLAKNGIRDFCLAVAEDEGADYILIDCPTAYNAATVAALGAADEIIIPVELEGFSLHGAGEIRSQVANMRTVNPRLRIAGALITKRRGTRIQEAAEQALRVSGIPAFEAAIPLRASVPASMSNLNASKTLMGYAPKDAATKAYHDFTREYLSKGGAVNGYQFRSVSKEAEKARKEIENLDTKANKSMNSSGGIGGGFKSITNALVTMQAAQMIGGAVQGSLNTKIGSALGSDSGTLASSMISSVLSGAITGSAFGPLGVLAGATVGGITGAISGSAQRYESQDSSFKSYVQDAVQEQLDAQSESLTSGSSIAAGRETDKISFATLFGSKETADSYLTNLVGMANSTPFLYDDLTSMSKTLATYGYDADSILPVLQTIGDAGAALGQSTNDMTAVATAIGRMKSSNKTTLEYLNILNDRGIGAVGMLSDAYGVDQGTMYSMISKGEVAGQDAARIILDALSDSFAGSMEAQSKTFSGITSTIEGLQQELDNAMGEGYNQTRMQGLEAQKEWLAGDSGQEMQEAYTAIGAWKASLENAKEQYIRDAMNDAMGSEEYKTAEAEGDAAEMGRILMKAKIDGMNEYNANEGKDEELAQELSLIESVRDDTALNNSYWDAGYTLGQEFSKGRAAATTDSAWADAVNNFNSGYTKHRSGHQRAMGIDYVPYDNFPALLHEGEKVLTAGEARQEKNGVGSIQIVINGMTVREDADIDRVAQALLSKLEEANMRG